ncbi:hypothetical protein X949_5176 [Burkholderia pseudomallei MSHR5609]|nr:hypothetical protein X949_5176 [Burkholderia pseudomallei MSHR5609]
MRIIIIIFVRVGKRGSGFFVTKPDAWKGFAGARRCVMPDRRLMRRCWEKKW